MIRPMGLVFFLREVAERLQKLQKQLGVAAKLRNSFKSCVKKINNRRNCNIRTNVANNGYYIDINATDDYNDITS